MSYSWIIDGHCDSIGYYTNSGRNIAFPDVVEGQWDLKRALSAKIGLQFLASYIEENYKPALGMQRGLQLIHASLDFIKENPEYTHLVLTKNDLNSLPVSGKVGLILSVEGGEILNGNLFMLDIIYHLGVRSLGLTWNQRNDLADGVDEENTQSRLTRFGEQVILRMNELGMVIDLSHINEYGFSHVLELSSQPVIVSHSCARAQCNHKRNLTDQQLRVLAKNNGVVGINFCPSFLVSDRKAHLKDVIRHIKHIADVAGINVIGLGSDFDGIPNGPEALEHVGCYPDLIDELSKSGFTTKEIDLITHGNFQRVLLDVFRN